MNQIKGLLFDMDGTLFNSRQAVVEAVLKTAEHYAPGKFCYSDIEERFGETWDSLANLLGCADKDAIVNTYVQFIMENLNESIIPFPGILENLLFLRRLGYNMAVVTNNLRNLTLLSLKFHEIDLLFDVIVTIDDVENGKPHPEPIEKACSQLDLKKGEVLMIGDSIYDVQAAAAAGTDCAVIDWYQSYCKSQWLPDYYFHNIDEFRELLIYQKKKKVG